MLVQPDGSNSLTAFEAEALPCHHSLYQSARSLLPSSAEAEDAVQETFLLAWKSFHKFDSGTNCRAWLFSILFNVVRQHRRKWLFRFKLTDDADTFERMAGEGDAKSERLEDPQILNALRTLPQKYAEVVLLADVEELSYKEIADAIRCPIGTVMSRLSRGRELLRNALTGVAREYGLLKAESNPRLLPLRTE